METSSRAYGHWGSRCRGRRHSRMCARRPSTLTVLTKALPRVVEARSVDVDLGALRRIEFKLRAAIMGSYKEFWRKIAIMVKVNLVKRDGSPFKIFDDASFCLGVPYQTAWNWITHDAYPRKHTLLKVVTALNENFLIYPPATLELLSDDTSIKQFAIALGAVPEEVENAILSVQLEDDGRTPMHWFAFERYEAARIFLSRIRGDYQITRQDISHRKDRKTDVELNINNITTFHSRHYVYARLVVYAEMGDNFRYDGFICERSGLLYWMFSQTGVMLSDFIFIVSDRIVPGNGADAFTAGTMITMGQHRPAPTTSKIEIRRLTPPQP
jgi:hypothetical protein